VVQMVLKPRRCQQTATTPDRCKCGVHRSVIFQTRVWRKIHTYRSGGRL